MAAQNGKFSVSTGIQFCAGWHQSGRRIIPQWGKCFSSSSVGYWWMARTVKFQCHVTYYVSLKFGVSWHQQGKMRRYKLISQYVRKVYSQTIIF